MKRLLSISLMLTLLFALACDEKPKENDPPADEPDITQDEAPETQVAPVVEETPGLDETEAREAREVLDAEAAEEITGENAEESAEALAAEIEAELKAIE